MTWWALQLFLLLILSCVPHAQLSTDWRSRFQPIEHYFDLHERQSPVIATTPSFSLVAPDVLRADGEENLYLEASGLSSDVTVTIQIQDFSTGNVLVLESATLSHANDYHVLKAIQLPSEQLGRDGDKNKFVRLKVQFGYYHTEERVVLVSFHSGYIFIQTDKPVYNPGDTVRCRAFVSTHTFKSANSTVTMEFKNAEGVVIKQTSRSKAVGGVLVETLLLSELVNEGTWTVIAKLDHWPQNTFTSPFEVKKYVLPAFNLTLSPKKSYFSLDDTELEVEIQARYLYGEPVQGTAYVVFGVQVNKEMRRLPSVKQVTDLDGGVVKLSIEELKAAYPNIRSLEGNSIYVKASVLTRTGSDLVEGQKTGIKIVLSPYVISFRGTPKFFKPGMPFDLTMQVSNHDGSPARNVAVKLSHLNTPIVGTSGTSGTFTTSFNMPKELSSHVITAETTMAHLKPEQQAKNVFNALHFQPFSTRDQNYLYISARTETLSVGDTLSLTMSISTGDQAHRAHVTRLTYLVLNRGKIIEVKRLDVTGHLTTSVAVRVTAEMMPSFRLVAFYVIPWTGRAEVVSDSIWVDVADTCVGALSVEPEDRGNRHYTPGKALNLKVRGDPGAKVNLVAVDNAVYLLSNQRLTQRKIWDVVEKGDMGCTRGGGRDSMKVFTDAGLLFSSSSGLRTQQRKDLQCQGSARRRRSAELLKRRTALEEYYKEKLLRRCCKDGLREIPMPYSCTRRSLYIAEGWECIRAFRYCCAQYYDQEFDSNPPTPEPPLFTTARPARRRIPHFRPLSRDRSRSMGTFVYTRMNAHAPPPGPPGPEGPLLGSAARGFGDEEDEEPVAATIEEEEDEDEEDEEYEDETSVYLRSKFYESWLWRDVSLPSSADGRDGLASALVKSILPDSITEWGIMAISASPDKGFCVAEPYNVKTFKLLFVDLKLPYSVARNEQIEIKAVLHNYADMDLHVRVVLMKTEGMCSLAFNERHTQEVDVAARSSLVVPYTIVPHVVGKLPVEVMVVVRDMMGGDRIQKLLRVVVEGVQKTKVQSFVLNPSTAGLHGKQVVRIDKVELHSVVPNSKPETFINIRGNVLADSIDNSISDDSLGRLIRMPGGCVEQNLATITLPLIATLYLDRKNDWGGVGVQRRDEALKYIRRGYENQLAYRKSDGSYPPYRKQGTSTWITAYVVKVFSMAYSMVGVAVGEQQVCDALLYLLQHKQQRAGSFKEDNPVYTTTMTGGLRGSEAETTLTAFVLIALAEARDAGILCTGRTGVRVEESTLKTAKYLKRMLPSLKRPYSVAIASYAVSMFREQLDFDPLDVLLRSASNDHSHWPDSENRWFTLEATGYALLALVKSRHMEEAAAAFNWLNDKRGFGGSFGPTQSTMVVLQALSEYLVNKPSQDMSLQVSLRVPGRRELRYDFDPDTSYVARSSKVPLGENLEIEARGNGQGILEVVTYYNQVHDVDENSACKNFELSVAIEESSQKRPADIVKSYEITIRVRALAPRDVRMVVLDISLPTGFTPENSDLEMLTNSVDRYISNFQVVDNLSDRGSLIIHLFKVSRREPEILTFRLQQNFKVGLLQPSSVTVYEYYNPDHRCNRVYTPGEDKDELSQICRDNVCRCTQGDCCVSKSDSQTSTSESIQAFACKTLHHVYQVKVLSVNQSYYDKYEMEITRLIKLGEEAGVEVGQRRIFMSNGGCREGLSLQQGSQYLIIGPNEDLWNIDSTTSRFNYMLGKNTWVERWPSSTECSSSPSLQTKCNALQEAALQLSVTGCRT